MCTKSDKSKDFTYPVDVVLTVVGVVIVDNILRNKIIRKGKSWIDILY